MTTKSISMTPLAVMTPLISLAPVTTLVLVLLTLSAGLQSARAEDLARFFGSYVGRATVDDPKTGTQQLRDLDIVISPYRSHGLQIDWVTVGLVDGKRDVVGVKRWSQTALFEPSEDQEFMVETGESSLFKERGQMEIIEGDPVRWTRVGDKTLYACSFVVLEDGRYELQIYQRILTETGMDILFERIVDGEVIRRVSGTTVRAG